jgi:putative Mg2+ transporter-C (MgtC) family protein
VTSTCNLPPSKARRMAPEIDWREIAFRLLLTILAGTLLGMERSRTGHFAGLRTTLLVMLAASVSMIQMNLLIQTNGKPHDSYAVMDVMRLPLGILTGVGFIGGGAILRKGDIIIGLTTAATMWFATVVGLCLGGGQLILGSVSTVIGFFVLWGLRHFETRIEHYQMAELRVTIAEDRLLANDLRARLEKAKFRIKSLSVLHAVDEHRRIFDCEVRWPSRDGTSMIPEVLDELEHLPGLVKIEWKSVGSLPS